MRERLPTGLRILFGLVSSQLGFAGALWSFHVWANSHHLANLANVDGWVLKVWQYLHTNNCTLQVPPFQASSFLLWNFCLLGIWVRFRVLNSCGFSIFFGSIVDTEKGAMSTWGVCMSNTNFKSSNSVLVRLLVTIHVCNVVEVEIVLLCYAL